MKQQHPLSAAYPSMQDDDFVGLVEDIRKHGQRDTATLYDGMVLDGWHRYRACLEIGIPCRFEEFSGNDPAAFVISKNTHRRQLTAGQRAAAVVAVRAWRPSNSEQAGQQTDEKVIHKGAPVHPSASVAQMAAESGVGERTIQQAKRGHEAGLGEAMRDGKISPKRASEIAKLPESERAAAIETPTAMALPEVTNDEELDAAAEVSADLAEKIVELTAQLEEQVVINEKLTALADMDCEGARLIDDLQKRLKRCQQTLAAAETQRDAFMRENAELKREVKMLRKQLAK